MTTYRAVAAATTAFAQRIRRSIAPLEGAIVTTERPNAPSIGGPPRVNLFLYHVDANPYRTTDDLPTRREDGSLIQKPKILLDLYYLLSFYGDDKLPALDPHILVGLTMSGVHAQPVLTPEELNAADSEIVGSDYIALTPLPLSIHELSRLWSMFVQVPYILSVSLKASAAVLIADLPAGPSLPVSRRGLEVVPYLPPVIAGVVPLGGAAALLPGGEALVTGSGFGGDGAIVTLGGVAMPLPPGSAVSNRMVLRLDAPDLRAGRQAMSVTTATGLRSAAVAVEIRPEVAGLSLQGLQLTVAVRPTVDADSDVAVLLDLIAGPPGAGSPAPDAQEAFVCPATPAPPDEVVADLTGLPPGRYAVRVRVGGAESLLGTDASGAPEPAITVRAAS